MPKPLFGDNGSGMHCHQSLWKDGEPLFYDEARLRRAVGHRALVHRRPAQPRAVAAGLHQPDGELLPPAGAGLRGAGQPGLLGRATARPACASRSRGPTRRPSGSSSACPTRRRNPYLAFSAMLMAGLDGIKNKIEPPEPVDKDLYELPPDEHASIQQVPGSLPAGARRARGRPRLPDRGRRLHPRPDRDLDRLQAHQRRSTRSGCARTRTSSSSTTTSDLNVCPKRLRGLPWGRFVVCRDNQHSATPGRA